MSKLKYLNFNEIWARSRGASFKLNLDPYKAGHARAGHSAVRPRIIAINLRSSLIQRATPNKIIANFNQRAKHRSRHNSASTAPSPDFHRRHNPRVIAPSLSRGTIVTIVANFPSHEHLAGPDQGLSSARSARNDHPAGYRGPSRSGHYRRGGRPIRRRLQHRDARQPPASRSLRQRARSRRASRRSPQRPVGLAVSSFCPSRNRISVLFR